MEVKTAAKMVFDVLGLTESAELKRAGIFHTGKILQKAILSMEMLIQVCPEGEIKQNLEQLGKELFELGERYADIGRQLMESNDEAESQVPQ